MGEKKDGMEIEQRRETDRIDKKRTGRIEKRRMKRIGMEEEKDGTDRDRLKRRMGRIEIRTGQIAMEI